MSTTKATAGGHYHKLTAAGILVTMGIIYGDIGTSPLYVLKAIVGESIITPELIMGGLSCIIWTLTLQTTFKYVIITLRADNKGEGGIFSLYALVRKRGKWLMFPAIIGGSALLADGIITPPISVASAIEGLEPLYHNIPTVGIVIAIITLLFVVQQFGTTIIGKFFAPVMVVWFGMLAVLGVSSIMCNDASVFKAINPYYAYNLLANYPNGFWLLSAVFLCTTGAEALYSDLGHCGRDNIRMSWIAVKLALILNYLGQGAYLLNHQGQKLVDLANPNPFYSIVPTWFYIPSVIIATLAAIVASQALISGSFTLINEAIRLNFWPKFKIVYPSDVKGQLYIPSVNWMLLAGCIGITLYFKESGAMEGAYGLSIVLCMLMTTLLMCYYLFIKRVHLVFIVLLGGVFATIELAFLVANLSKFEKGGNVTLGIALILVLVMYVWFKARKIRNRYVEFNEVDTYYGHIKDLSTDLSIPKYATHLVYLTSANRKNEIESKVIYSMMQRQPKRADIYWFVHVDVVDSPYTMEYKVTELLKDDLIRIDFRLGFRVEPRINLMFRKVVQDMVKNGEVDITSRYESLNKNNVVGDFKFVVIEKFLSNENELPFMERLILNIYFMLKELSLPEEKAFGLDTSSVVVEKFPMIVAPIKKEICLTRIH